MKEQRRNLKQKHSAYVIFDIALVALSIVLIIVALSQKPKCVNATNDTISTVERKPIK